MLALIATVVPRLVVWSVSVSLIMWLPSSRVTRICSLPETIEDASCWLRPVLVFGEVARARSKRFGDGGRAAFQCRAMDEAPPSMVAATVEAPVSSMRDRLVAPVSRRRAHRGEGASSLPLTLESVPSMTSGDFPHPRAERVGDTRQAPSRDSWTFDRPVFECAGDGAARPASSRRGRSGPG